MATFAFNKSKEFFEIISYLFQTVTSFIKICLYTNASSPTSSDFIYNKEDFCVSKSISGVKMFSKWKEVLKQKKKWFIITIWELAVSDLW